MGFPLQSFTPYKEPHPLSGPIPLLPSHSVASTELRLQGFAPSVEPYSSTMLLTRQGAAPLLGLLIFEAFSLLTPPPLRASSSFVLQLHDPKGIQPVLESFSVRSLA